MNSTSFRSGWVYIWLIVVFCGDAHAWYPESGFQVSGVGAYDSTRKVYLLIAFHDQDTCSSANIYIDTAISDQYRTGVTSKQVIELSIDSNPSWDISLQPKELHHWLPGTVALTGIISPQALKQLRWGKRLTVKSGNSNLFWSLKGSNRAILSAYDNCLK